MRLRAPLALAVGAPLAGIVVLLLVVVADAPVAAGVAVVLVAGVAGALGRSFCSTGSAWMWRSP
ncbi:MAG: hypothetical protein R2789_00775 [Microthrixaceae bacterium]